MARRAAARRGFGHTTAEKIFYREPRTSAIVIVGWSFSVPFFFVITVTERFGAR
jgi:hypothetical protein